MNSEILQSMRILTVDSIYPLEYDTNIDSAMEMDEIHHIRHPMLVTKLEGDRYLLLDQSEEFYLYLKAGITHLPVQIVSAEEIKCKQQKIGLYSFDSSDVEKVNFVAAHSIKKLQSEGQPDTSSQKIVTIEFEAKKFRFALTGSSSEQISSLRSLFLLFERHGGYGIVKENQPLQDRLMRANRYKAAVIAPDYSLTEMSEAAQVNLLFPPNICKFETSLRMLYLDFPVSALMADISIEEKEEFLRELILLREQTEKTSFFHGRVYLFNK